MQQYLLEHLGIISDEEQKILNGSNCVEKHIYTDTQDFIVDFRKMSNRRRLINVRPHTRFIHFPVHRHDYIEIVWVCGGTMTHVINGAKAVKLEKGDLLFLNRVASHEVLPCDRGDLAVNILARPEFFDRSFFAQAPDSGRFFDFVFAQGANPQNETYIHFPTSGILPVQNLSENLIWNVLNEPNPNRDVDRPTMALLMSHLFNHLEKSPRDEPYHFERSVAIKALMYIDENYQTARLDQFAAQQGLPPYYVSKVIKKRLGNSYKSLLQRRRLEESARLLTHTPMPVEAVVAAVGYENDSYFHRIFRECYGLTPHDFRKRQR